MKRNEIIKKVGDAGVVGCGGAGFPTHVKIDARAETVIANGASCEPLLHSDIHLMEHDAAGIAAGLGAVMQAVGAERGVVALKRKHGAAVEAVRRSLLPGMEIFELDDFYPAGDEQLLVLDITGAVVPEAGLPLDVGAVVDNVETLLNVAAALEGRPVTMRCLTVAGAVVRPGVVWAPVGTPFEQALEQAGGSTLLSPGFLEGGPMMGRPVRLDGRVSKTTTGLIALPGDHAILQRRETPLSSILRRAASACTQCSYCTDLCPRYLIGHRLRPHLIMRSAAYGRFGADGFAAEALICCECGVCETTACNMGLSPMRVNQMLKRKLAEEGVKFPRSESAPEPNAQRSWRLAPSRTVVQRAGLLPWFGQQLSDLGVVRPRSVEIDLKQHIGVACKPAAAVGDRVEAGQKIGEVPAGKLGAPVHASMGGKVTAVTESMIRIEG